MYLVQAIWYDSFKTRTLREAITFLEMCGVGDLEGLRRDLRNDGAWYNNGEGALVEKHDGRTLRHISYAPI